MTDPDLSQQFNWLQAEIDALRARNDVLTTALKYTVKSSPQAARLIALIEKELHEAKVSATLSGVPSNVYRDAFAAASGNVSKFRHPLITDLLPIAHLMPLPARSPQRAAAAPISMPTAQQTHPTLITFIQIPPGLLRCQAHSLLPLT